MPITKIPQKRCQEILRHLKDFDIVTFQEAFSKRVHDTIEQADFSYKFVGQYGRLIPFFQRLGNGLAILSRYPIVETAWIKFSNFWVTDFDIFANKGVLFSRIQIDKNTQIDVYTTHLQATNRNYYSDFIRHRQLKTLKEFIISHSQGNPIIVTGDFNIPDNSPMYPAITYLLQAKDSWAESKSANLENPEKATCHDENGFTSCNENTWNSTDPHERNQRIDYIFYKNGRSSSLEVVDSEVVFKNELLDGENLSDHFALSSTFKLINNPPINMPSLDTGSSSR